MSIKAVLLWLVAAIVLLGTTLFLLRSAGPAGASTPGNSGVIQVGERLVTLVPSGVQSIAVAHPDGSTDTVERRAADFDSPIGSDAEWFVRMSRAGAAPTAANAQASPRWPVMGPSMQGLLRTLADVRAIALPDREATLGTGPTVVTLTFRDGARRVLRLADRTLAGAGLVELSQPVPSSPTTPSPPNSAPTEQTVRAIVSDELHRVFTNPGPRAWRDRNFLTAIANDASRVRLENPRQRLALGKTDGRWGLREPVAAPADPGAVQRLLSALAKISIDDFLDFGAPGASTGLESPSARIELEADRRSISDSGEVRRDVARLELAIGSPADTSSRRVFAAIGSEYRVLLDARGLDTLSLDAGSYIWPGATRTPAPDVGIVVLARGGPSPAEGGGPVAAATGPERSVRSPAAPAASAEPNRTILKRSGARWVRVQPDGLEMMLAEQELKDADSMLSFLCGSDHATAGTPPQSPTREANPAAPKIEIVAPEGFRTLAVIELRSPADAPLETIEAGAARPGWFTLKTGEVFRTWPFNRVPPMLAGLVVTPLPPTNSTGPEPEPEPEMK